MGIACNKVQGDFYSMMELRPKGEGFCFIALSSSIYVVLRITLSPGRVLGFFRLSPEKPDMRSFLGLNQKHSKSRGVRPDFF